MDKKKRIKMVSAVCFVLICGGVCLWMHYGKQRKEQIVWEQSDAVNPGSSEGNLGADEMAAVQKETTEGFEKAEIGLEESDVLSESGSEIEGQPEESQKETLETVICVHLCGAVTTEGVYILPEGSRLIDGVTAAGGFLAIADTSYHNLASLLTDGQKVYVPTKEETKEVPVEERTQSSGSTGSEKPGKNKETKVSAKVNINTAGIEELTTLSGIGESKAKSIVQYREKVGAFQSIEELKQVSGIGDAMFERVKEDITVE